MSQPAGGRNFQIDKLLETVVKEKVSDLHITVGGSGVALGQGFPGLETMTAGREERQEEPLQ